MDDGVLSSVCRFCLLLWIEEFQMLSIAPQPDSCTASEMLAPVVDKFPHVALDAWCSLNSHSAL